MARWTRIQIDGLPSDPPRVARLLEAWKALDGSDAPGELAAVVDWREVGPITLRAALGCLPALGMPCRARWVGFDMLDEDVNERLAAAEWEACSAECIARLDGRKRERLARVSRSISGWC